MTPQEGLAWAAEYLDQVDEVSDRDQSRVALLSIAHSLYALTAMQVHRPAPGRPEQTPDEVPLPVATDQQMAKWTGQISNARDVRSVAQVLDELMGYAMPSKVREDLTSMAWQRNREIRA